MSVPLIGFSGSPWTLAAVCAGHRGRGRCWVAKQFLYNHPEAMHLLLERLADAVTEYLSAQIEAGAQAVQIFDTWGGILLLRLSGNIRCITCSVLSRVCSRKGCLILCRSFCLRRMAGNGLRPLLTRVVMLWVWTGPLTFRGRGHESGARSHCKETWIPPSCMRSPEVIRAEVQRILRDYDNGPRACLQSRARHHSGCRPRECGRVCSGRARIFLC